MTQEFPSRGNWGAPGQLNPSTQLEGDQKTPAFPTRGFQSQYVPTAAEGVLSGAIYDLDPSKFDFFLKAGEDNEELRAQDQTVAEMLGKGAGRFALTTLTKTLEGIGFVGALPSALANWDLNKAVDNSFSEWFSELEEDIKEDLLPILKTIIIFILLTIYAVIKRIKQGYNNIKDSITRIVNKRLISRKANKENNRKKA